MITALHPINQYLEQLLELTHAYTETKRVSLQAGSTPVASRLWLELSFLPVNIVLAALEEPEPPTGPDEPPRKLVDHDWLLHAMDTLEPEPLDEPVNVIDLAKARQQRQNRISYSTGQHLLEPATVPADYIPPIPEDAFLLMGSKGKFAIAESDGGHLIGRWVNQKKGPKFSRHFIPSDGECDCKAAQLGHNCCHSKALDHYLYSKKEQARIERERERERLELLNRNRYQVTTGDDTDHGSFSSELHAVAKLEVLSYQGFDVKIYDRLEDKIIRSYSQPKLAAS